MTQGVKTIAYRMVTLVVLTLGMAACAEIPALPPTVNTLDVLGPDQEFADAVAKRTLPPTWSLSGQVHPSALRIQSIDGLPALQVTPGTHGFALTRNVRAPLLALPYLSWSWHVQAPKRGNHPVRLIIGLADRTKEKSRAWWQFSTDNTPPIDRVITVVWGDTALKRGTVFGPARDEDGTERVRYIARGGPEQGGQWWVDTIDLSLIHHQLWPNDTPGNMDVLVIGIAAEAAAHTNAPMNIATLRLTH
jgi:hypothetical protein